jgi:hypothetical protein
MVWRRHLPSFPWQPGSGIDLGHVLKTAPDDFREGPFFGGGNLFGLMEQVIGDLDLRLDHDGNLP